MPGALAIQSNVFQPVARLFAYRRCVGPCIRTTRSEADAGSYSKRRATEDLLVKPATLSSRLSIDVEPKVLYFQTCSPFEQGSIIVSGSCERLHFNRGGLTCERARRARSIHEEIIAASIHKSVAKGTYHYCKVPRTERYRQRGAK